MSSPHPATLLKNKNFEHQWSRAPTDKWNMNCTRDMSSGAFEAEPRKNKFSFTQIQKFAMLQSIWSAKKEKSYCLSNSITYISLVWNGSSRRRSSVPHSCVAASTDTAVEWQKNTFYLSILLPIFSHYYFVLFALAIISMDSGCLHLVLSLCPSHASFVCFLTISCAYWNCCCCLVVACRVDVSVVDHIIFARWIHFNVTLHIHYFDKDPTRGSVFRFYNLSVRTALHAVIASHST